MPLCSHMLWWICLKLGHNVPWVMGNTGYSGNCGPRSHMGPMAHFMKFCKMLLLLQILLYCVDGLSQWYFGGGSFGVFRNLWSKVPYGPYGPFYQILQNASSPTDSVVLCWWFVTMILWWWFFGVFRNFGSEAQDGPKDPFCEILKNT